VIEQLRDRFSRKVSAIIISVNRSTELNELLQNTDLNLLEKPVIADELHKKIISSLE
jgi:hypothetical protein